MSNMFLRFLVAFPLVLLSPNVLDAQASRWDLEEVWRTDSDAWLTEVSDLVVTEGGDWVVVGQPQTFEVVVLDGTTGQRKVSFGGRGQGPGEFVAIKNVGAVGDTVFVLDLGQSRISLFSISESVHVRTSRVVSEVSQEARRPALPMRLTPEGTFWAEPPLAYTPVANGRVVSVPVLLLDSLGATMGRVVTKDVERTIGFAPVRNAYILFPQPLVRPAVVAYAGNGSSMLHVENVGPGSSRIRRYSHRGALLYDEVLQQPRKVLSREARDSIHAAFAARRDDMGSEWVASARRAAEEHVVIPEFLPAVTEAVLGSDGTAWLRADISGEWLILDPRGMQVGSAVVPQRVGLFAVDGSNAWGVWRDAYDVPYVVKFRLVRR